MASTTNTRDRSELEPPPPISGRVSSTRGTRQLAVAQWLMSAATSREEARHEWATYGMALLRCGTLFTAVRIPAAYMHAAAEAEAPDTVASFLTGALDGGPVFYDPRGRHFYALVPASTARLWDVPFAECFGRDSFLGVPAINRVGPDGTHDAYWVVPMDGPGDLCAADDVADLVLYGRQAAAKAQAKEAAKEPKAHE
ncbi:hypothetical protein ABZX75_17775 [Streptomyces sp. NPDC003038]|uniref:hypothetical protein n=1 Tax=unclassified Streptomyces TaxID=2593676 RepID=UPI0033AC4C65